MIHEKKDNLKASFRHWFVLTLSTVFIWEECLVHDINLNKWVGRPVAFNLQNPHRKKIQMCLTYSMILVIQDLILCSFFSWISFKVRLSPPYLLQWKLFKNDEKNFFFFMLKAVFIFEIFIFVLTFW